MMGLRRYVALAGFALGALGAAVERPLMVWAAIGLLGVVLLLRLIAGFRNPPPPSRSDTVSASDDG